MSNVCFRLDWDLDTDVWTLAMVDDCDTWYMELMQGTFEECMAEVKRRQAEALAALDINQNREEAGA